MTFGNCISIEAGSSRSLLQSVNNRSGGEQVNKDAIDLETGKPIERELKAGEAHTYQVSLSLNQFLRVVVDQRGIDVVVSLFGPDGKQIAEVDSPNGTQGPEPVSVVSDAAGGYRLEIRSLEKGVPPGRYEIKVEELRSATQQDSLRIAAERSIRAGRAAENARHGRILEEGNSKIRGSSANVSLSRTTARRRDA